MAFKDKQVFSKLFIAFVATAFISIPIGFSGRLAGYSACEDTIESANFIYETSKGKSLALLPDRVNCSSISKDAAWKVVYTFGIYVWIFAFIVIDYKSDDRFLP